MKKIILTIILSSLLPALAVAEDKKMQNTQPKAEKNTDMEGKHMRNTHIKEASQSEINMKTKKHMGMGDNPFSSHDKKVAKKAKKVSETNRGYTVIKYQK